MASESWLRRTQRAELQSEARRQHFLDLKRDEGHCEGADHGPAPIIQVVGRCGKKNGEKICGAYIRVAESDGAEVLYQGFDAQAGALCDNAFLILGSTRQDRRWRFVPSPDVTKKGFAYNDDGTSFCPTKVSKPWVCYDGREAGYNSDTQVAVIEIPIGFEPTCVPTYEVHEVVPDGPGAGVELQVVTEQDDSQFRRLSPRAFIQLP